MKVKIIIYSPGLNKRTLSKTTCNHSDKNLQICWKILLTLHKKKWKIWKSLIKIIRLVILYLPAKRSPDPDILENPIEWITSIFIQSVLKMENKTLPQLIYEAIITVVTNTTWMLQEKKCTIKNLLWFKDIPTQLLCNAPPKIITKRNENIYPQKNCTWC